MLELCFKLVASLCILSNSSLTVVSELTLYRVIDNLWAVTTGGQKSSFKRVSILDGYGNGLKPTIECKDY